LSNIFFLFHIEIQNDREKFEFKVIMNLT